jgi:hypothetical protein
MIDKGRIFHRIGYILTHSAGLRQFFHLRTQKATVSQTADECGEGSLRTKTLKEGDLSDWETR